MTGLFSVPSSSKVRTRPVQDTDNLSNIGSRSMTEPIEIAYDLVHASEVGDAHKIEISSKFVNSFLPLVLIAQVPRFPA